MKNLVLGALLAVAASTGCVASSDNSGDVLVDVNWKFTQLADNSVIGCPAGFDTARIVSQATDDTTHVGTGQMFTDLFDCAAGHGTILLPDDTYLIWVEIENSSGSSSYAQSQETFYDTLVDTASVDAEIIDDGGFLFLTWDLVTSGTQMPLTCASAGVPANGGVRTVATGISSPTFHTDDLFTCEDHYGTTDPLLAGTYVIAIDAEDSTGALGNSTSVNATVRAPSGLTDLGHILIPID